MLLYHFTDPVNVMQIAGEGLKPAAKEYNAFMTAGVPVVWLTRQPTNILTTDDAAYLEMIGGTATEGQQTFGGSARLIVRLEPNNKRLKRYADFLQEKDITVPLIPSARTDWFIYLGSIPLHRIDAHIPAAVMLECLDHHIATHPDADARERFKAARAQVEAVPPDQMVDFTVEDDDAQ